MNGTRVALIGIIVGGISTIVSVVGNFDSQVNYCDAAVNPCAQVTIPVWQRVPKTATLVNVIPGNGFQRTVGGLLAACGFALGVTSTSTAIELLTEEEKTKQQEDETAELIRQEELQKIAIASNERLVTFERDLKDAHSLQYLQQNPELIDHFLPRLQPQPIAEESIEETFVEENPIAENAENIETVDPVKSKIPPAIQIMKDSDLSTIVDAGIINLVGAQGSGKTTTGCMLLRYRVWRNHKLIIVNPHKKKSMYNGLESSLLTGTTFYGVGTDRNVRAESLLAGLEAIRKFTDARYAEYQNLDEKDYNHFPVTVLLEECAEYKGLLTTLNRPAVKEEGDPGFNAKKYLEEFWLSIFVSIRKGNGYIIRTIQTDTNAANGTEGLSDLIKSTGACTLTQFSVPDGECLGGWRSTGQGEIKIPNQKYLNDKGDLVEEKPVIVPTYFDYVKVLKDITDFQDLNQSERKLIVVQDERKITEAIETLPELPSDLLERAIAQLNSSFSLEMISPDSDLDEINRELLKPSQDSRPEEPSSLVSDSKRYTTLKLSFDEAKSQIEKLRNENLNQKQIIKTLWDAAPGGSKKYKAAISEYKELIKEEVNA